MEEKYKDLCYHLDGLNNILTDLDNLIEGALINFESNEICGESIDKKILSLSEKNIDECRYNIDMIKRTSVNKEASHG